MSQCTILTVEDEPAISDILRVNLSFAGYDVISANNVTQAESLIKTTHPRLNYFGLDATRYKWANFRKTFKK